MSNILQGAWTIYVHGIYWWYTGGIRVVYGWYTGGIRVVYGWYTVVYGSIRKYTVINFSIATVAVYGGIRRYTEVYGSIRKYTVINFSIATIGGIRRYTEVYGGIRVVYGWYTGGIRCQL